MNRILKVILSIALLVPFLMAVEVTTIQSVAFAQEDAKPKPRRKGNRVQSILTKHVKTFERINAAFEEENLVEAERLLDKFRTEEGLNNITKANIANLKGNIYFSKDDLNGALREFKSIMGLKEGLPINFYNQIMYVVAQVYFSQENYREALKFAQMWFKTQEVPTADGYMLLGQAHYMLKDYDASLPNVKKGIQLYIDLGSVPKEAWLNLLSSIYRQKNNFKEMLPVLKLLVLHYPKKIYLLTMGGVYNELDDPERMSAIYQAMHDKGLLTAESEIVTLASLQLSQDNPFKAAEVIEKGLQSGAVKKNLSNYRIYSQALYLAKEYEKAVVPLSQAASRSKDGKLYDQLGQSFIALNRWKEAGTALNNALKKGKLSNTGATLLSQGMVRFEQKRYDDAKVFFNRALKHEKVVSAARNWIKYVDSEVYRIKEANKEIIINTDVEV